ncbi:MAG: hypothetical protein KAT65_21455 [Methanophagales archaeon]|jgi:hypothetical protein|nr:hypothetical protein [Methanophagales archaeon]
MLRKIIKGIVIVIVILGVLNVICWTLFATPPTEEEVDGFLSEYASEYKFVTETDPYIEYQRAHYLRTHTACIFGKIFRVSPPLCVATPFHYFNYFEFNASIYPFELEQHTYIFVKTRDYGFLVYNPVNGEYVGRYDELIERMEEKCLENHTP